MGTDPLLLDLALFGRRAELLSAMVEEIFSAEGHLQRDMDASDRELPESSRENEDASCEKDCPTSCMHRADCVRDDDWCEERDDEGGGRVCAVMRGAKKSGDSGSCCESCDRGGVCGIMDVMFMSSSTIIGSCDTSKEDVTGLRANASG